MKQGDFSPATGGEAISPSGRRASQADAVTRSATRIAGYVIGVVALVAVLAVTLPAFVGYHTVIITGGSMASALPVGSVAVTRTVDFEDVRPGDVIAFQRPGAALPVVHRIVEIHDTNDGRVATTKGDANAEADPQPLPLNGRGDRVAYFVPWIGYGLVFVRTPLGAALILIAGAASWLTLGRGPRGGRVADRRVAI